MGVDNETAPSSINICISDNEKYLKKCRDEAESNGLRDNKDEGNHLQIEDSNHNISCEEYYFEDGIFLISASMQSSCGEASVYLTIPLSDTVLIDILAHSIKKFNKLKSVIESLS